MIGELNEQQIEALLRETVVGRIACHQDDFIYLVPVSYAYDGTYIYAHSNEGTKLDVMRKNPIVCFEVDDVTDMTNWRSVIAWGRFEELTAENRKKGLTILLQRQLPMSSSVTTHLGKTWPFSQDDFQDITGIIYRIALTKKTGRCEQTSFAPPDIL